MQSSPDQAKVERDKAVRAEHDGRIEAMHEENARVAAGMMAPPTPSQEENDMLALGLMHPDDKTSHEFEPPKPAAGRSVPRSSPTPTSTSSTSSSSRSSD